MASDGGSVSQELQDTGVLSTAGNGGQYIAARPTKEIEKMGEVTATTKNEVGGPIHSYKGFSDDMTCYGGFQYEENKSYESRTAKACAKGFHACENPLFCLGHKPPYRSLYHEVIQDGTIDKCDDKTASTKITIGRRLYGTDMAKAALCYIRKNIKSSVEYNGADAQSQFTEVSSDATNKFVIAAQPDSVAVVPEHTYKRKTVLATEDGSAAVVENGTACISVAMEKHSVSIADGLYNASIAAGMHSVSAASGMKSVAVAPSICSMADADGLQNVSVVTSEYSAASVRGGGSVSASVNRNTKSAADGISCIAANTGDNSTVASDGDYSISVSTGDDGKSKAKGNRCASVVTSRYSASTSDGENSVAASTGVYGTVTANGKRSTAVSTGVYGTASEYGDNGVSASTHTNSKSSACGKRVVSVTTGGSGTSTANGDYSVSASTGGGSVSVTDGNHCIAAAAGKESAVKVNGGVAVATGENSVSIANGNFSMAVAAGERTNAVAGEMSIAAAIGDNSTAEGKIGSWLVLVQREIQRRDGMLEWFVKDVRAFYVDGTDIKPDTKYFLWNGEAVEAER